MKTPEQVYARETVLMKDYPKEVPVIIQAMRIGDVGIAAIPCEVFVEIGLAIKQKSPFKPTFTIELANGYNGYLPTPEQHKLGGYETWRARHTTMNTILTQRWLLNRRYFLRGLGAIALALLAVSLARAEERSFLHAEDRVVVIGDSISARGVFCSQIERVLNAVYPGNRISITNKAVGGQQSQGGLETLRQHIEQGGAPTVALVMLCVNDLKMRPDNPDAKEQEYLKWMRQFAPLARQHKIQLIFLTETPFGHNAKPGQFENHMNVILDRLTAALIRMAREQNVPVIDVHSAYVRGLHQAWEKDPRYEFSPDVIHPLPSGEACIAATILGALGVGLPLAEDGRRGPIRVDGPATVELTAADDVQHCFQKMGHYQFGSWRETPVISRAPGPSSLSSTRPIMSVA